MVELDEDGFVVVKRKCKTTNKNEITQTTNINNNNEHENIAITNKSPSLNSIKRKKSIFS